MNKGCQNNVLSLPQQAKLAKRPRKTYINQNREGSVRRINNHVYVDFIYLGKRVREPSGLKWNEENFKKVRRQLDRIMDAIECKTFRFHEVFPQSKKREYFQKQEMLRFGFKRKPDEITFKETALKWYSLRRDSQRIEGRTLLGYKSYINGYLIPFFGNMTFSQFNAATFEAFIAWARKQRLRQKAIGNSTINKFFVPLKMICNHVAIEYGWAGTYNPFFGFKKLCEDDPSEKISPFSLMEQHKLIQVLPDHWKPYFSFAFCSGLRQGEQIGLKPDDIDWENSILSVRRGITLDEAGKRIEGKTKNKYSRRKVKLTETILDALTKQKVIHNALQGEYFFCTENGDKVDASNLRKNVWLPSLSEASLSIRDMRQTRHSFATNALSHGENPLWIAKVMGHRNADMIIKVYSKYIENAKGTADGESLTNAYRSIQENKEKDE